MTKWLIVLFLLAPAAARAQQARPDQQFAAVMQNAGHQQTVLDAARASPAWTHIGCATATFTHAPEIGVYAQIRFNQAGAPIAGEWREGVVATGCGVTLTLNVLTKITAPATLATGALLPGGTIADPVLQNAAQAYAVAAAGGIPAACHDAYIANTVFAGYEAPPDPNLPAGTLAAPWKETWTLSLCGPAKTITLHFKPDAQGVTIAAD